MAKTEQQTGPVKQRVMKQDFHDNKSDSRVAGEFGAFFSSVKTEAVIKEAVKKQDSPFVCGRVI